MKTLTTTGTFPRGLVIEGVTYTEFAMREVLLADLIDAESDAGGTDNGIAFHAEQAVRQLTEVKSADGQRYEGPFVRSMIKTKPDFIALRAAQIRLDSLGNGEQVPGAAAGT